MYGKKSNGLEKSYTWVNTNKLLAKGFNGVKTGITPSAGACLSASYQDDKDKLIIVVLACKTPDHKWHEVLNLKNWALNVVGSKTSIKKITSPRGTKK